MTEEKQNEAKPTVEDLEKILRQANDYRNIENLSTAHNILVKVGAPDHISATVALMYQAAMAEYNEKYVNSEKKKEDDNKPDGGDETDR